MNNPALAREYQAQHSGTTIVLGAGMGTGARIQALADGNIDIALASQGVIPEELARRGLAAHEMAKVAVVFAVNASVPIASLTERQLCDLYAGAVTNWREVGGPDLGLAAHPPARGSRRRGRAGRRRLPEGDDDGWNGDRAREAGGDGGVPRGHRGRDRDDVAPVRGAERWAHPGARARRSRAERGERAARRVPAHSPELPGSATADIDGWDADAGVVRAATDAQRRRLVALRADGTIGDAAFQRVEEELDWAELDWSRFIRSGEA